MKLELLGAALLLAAATNHAPRTAPDTTHSSPPASFLGEWHGTSTCVDRVFAPACKDEVVIYRCTPVGAAKDTVHLAAYKIVSGEEQFMGEFDFARSGRGSDWTADFQNTRVHARWRFHVADTIVTGDLIDVPTGKQVRRVRVTRAKSAGEVK